MAKTIGKIEYISMAEAAEITPYAQDYLSLLCRRNQLKSNKIGRKWYTTERWLNEYLKEKKPSDVIEDNKNKRDQNQNKTNRKFMKIWPILTVLVFVFLVFVFGNIIWQKINIIEASKNNFVPEEITKVPNEQGGYDIYGEGRMKIGEEKIEDKGSIMLNP